MYRNYSSPWKKETSSRSSSVSPPPYRTYPLSSYSSGKPSSGWHDDGLHTSFESDYSGTSSYNRPLSSTRRVPSYDSFSYGLTSSKPLTDFKVNECYDCGRTFELMSTLFKHEAVCPVKMAKLRQPYYYEYSLASDSLPYAQSGSFLYTCNYCLRKFNNDTLARHLPICRRITTRRFLDMDLL